MTPKRIQRVDMSHFTSIRALLLPTGHVTENVIKTLTILLYYREVFESQRVQSLRFLQRR